MGRGKQLLAEYRKKVRVSSKAPVSNERSRQKFTTVNAQVEREGALCIGGLQERDQRASAALAAALLRRGHDGVDASALPHQAVEHVAKAGRVLVPGYGPQCVRQGCQLESAAVAPDAASAQLPEVREHRVVHVATNRGQPAPPTAASLQCRAAAGR